MFELIHNLLLCFPRMRHDLELILDIFLHIVIFSMLHDVARTLGRHQFFLESLSILRVLPQNILDDVAEICKIQVLSIFSNVTSFLFLWI